MKHPMIEPATDADLDALVALGCEFRAAVYADLLPENPAQMRILASSLLQSATGTILVAREAGELIGMLGLTAFAHPLSGLWTVAELFWYVQPSARGTLGLRLLKAGERWARDRHALRLQVMAPNADVEQLYERLGFHSVERSYEKSL
jgi:RimJ/RimL family protein N-acetyltransferase